MPKAARSIARTACRPVTSTTILREPPPYASGRDSVRLNVFHQRQLTLRLGANLSEINADASTLRLVLVIALPAMVALVSFGGWWLARAALAPIRELTEAAEHITAERLDRRLTLPPVEDEVGRLCRVLNAMFDRLDAGFRQAVRFSADASHELKTPLTILRVSIEDLLNSPALSEEDRGAVSDLLEQTHRLSDITEKLLLLSRADTGRLTLDLVATDLGEVVTACVEDAQIIAQPHEVSIEFQALQPMPATIDPGRISQLLLNLLENAVKYTAPGGLVKVTAGAEGGFSVIRVANSGSPIPPEAVPHLFERFYRSQSVSDAPGQGLGLSIARELARAHGGDITLERSDAEWTVFRVQVGRPLEG